jgi:hypothetical protein
MKEIYLGSHLAYCVVGHCYRVDPSRQPLLRSQGKTGLPRWCDARE